MPWYFFGTTEREVYDGAVGALPVDGPQLFIIWKEKKKQLSEMNMPMKISFLSHAILTQSETNTQFHVCDYVIKTKTKN